MDFELLTTLGAWQAIAPQWDALLVTSHMDIPYLRYDFMSTWWHTRGGGEWDPQTSHLRIVLAYHENHLVGIAPLFEAPDTNGQSVLHLIGTIEVADYLDLIAAKADLPEFIPGLLTFIASHSLTQGKPLKLVNILEHSASLPLLHTSASALGWQIQQERLQPCPQVFLPADWEKYLAGLDKKQRHEIRRKMRRLENAEVSSRWLTVTDKPDLEARMGQFLHMMSQDPSKQTFLTPTMRQFFSEVSTDLYESGFLHFSFLEIDGQSAASYFCLQYGKVLWVYNSAWQAAYSEYSPGWVLLSHLVQWAIENEFEAIDFMRGDEAYKYKFGGVDRFIARVSLYQP